MPEFRDNNNNQNKDKSALAVVMEIMKLLGLLCIKLIKKLGKLILKGLKFILKWTIKGIIFIIDAIDKGCNKIKQFWNNNDTQQKRKKILRAIKNGAIAILKGIGIALLFILKGILWILRKIFGGILHLKTNLKTLGQWVAKTCRRFAAWIKKKATSTKEAFKKIKYNYKSFRRNQGFKGLLFDTRNLLKSKITEYIEVEQEDDDNESEQDVEIEIDTEIEEDDTDAGPIRRAGRKIYRAMKHISDIE